MSQFVCNRIFNVHQHACTHCHTVNFLQSYQENAGWENDHELWIVYGAFKCDSKQNECPCSPVWSKDVPFIGCNIFWEVPLFSFENTTIADPSEMQTQKRCPFWNTNTLEVLSLRCEYTTPSSDADKRQMPFFYIENKTSAILKMLKVLRPSHMIIRLMQGSCSTISDCWMLSSLMSCQVYVQIFSGYI